MSRKRITNGAELLEADGPVTVGELAAVIRCSEGYVRKLIRCGVLEVHSLGAHYRIAHDDALRLAREAGALE